MPCHHAPGHPSWCHYTVEYPFWNQLHSKWPWWAKAIRLTWILVPRSFFKISTVLILNPTARRREQNSNMSHGPYVAGHGPKWTNWQTALKACTQNRNGQNTMHPNICVYVKNTCMYLCTWMSTQRPHPGHGQAGWPSLILVPRSPPHFCKSFALQFII